MADPKQKPRSQSSASIQTAQIQKRQTNILKFINQSNSAKKVESKKCKPQQLFGYNQQSPDQFKSKYSFKADNGYFYAHDINPENQKFEHYSQKHFIDLGKLDQKKKNQKQYISQYKQSYQQNKLAFHRKKGRLSEFMDKNKWMKPNYIIMGKQRNQTARNCDNKDRDRLVRAKHEQLSKQQKKMQTPQNYKHFSRSPHSRFGHILIGEKVKIRELRNQFASIQMLGSSGQQSQNKGQFRPKTTISPRKAKDNSENATTLSLRLLDNRPKQFQKTIDLWDKEDSQKIKMMAWTKPEKADEWMQTTCGSKFQNPKTAFSLSKKRNSYQP